VLKKYNLPVYIVLTAAFFVVAGSEVNYTGSDPKGTLLVSQAILEHGTIQLDSYGPEVLQGFDCRITNGHCYYFFPLGTPLAALPFVASAHAFGIDMLYCEAEIQGVIVTIVAALTMLMLFKIARLYLPFNESMVLALLCWFGSSFAGTTGTALWSHNFAALFALMAIYIAVASAHSGCFRLWPLLALCLFSAYLCRPTMALLWPCMLVFLSVHNKTVALITAFLLAFCPALFMIFSISEFGQVLPDYYLPQRLAGGHFMTALYGNLFSPARGLFIFSPFFLLPFLLIPALRNHEKRDTSLMLIALVWPIVHLLMISRYPHWWAGHSFGSRFMTDALPGLFVLLCYVLSAATPRSRRFAWFFLAITGCFSLYVNSWQGLYNSYTFKWNVDPNIDTYPEYVFDWNYPQFFHNKERHERRLMDFQKKDLAPLAQGQVIEHTSPNVVFIGWSWPEEKHRWSLGRKSGILFKVKEADVFKGTIALHGVFLGKQRVRISLNGTCFYDEVIEGGDRLLEAEFSPALLNEGDNLLDFSLPNARRPRNGDSRMLALAFKTLTIY
jgi:hypothetical protein